MSRVNAPNSSYWVKLKNYRVQVELGRVNKTPSPTRFLSSLSCVYCRQYAITTISLCFSSVSSPFKFLLRKKTIDYLLYIFRNVWRLSCVNFLTSLHFKKISSLLLKCGEKWTRKKWDGEKFLKFFFSMEKS